MSEIMHQVGLWIEGIIQFLGYPGIALVMLAENLFPPIPSELVMPFAGFLVADGRMNFGAAVVAGTTGSVLGAVVLYYIGRWADEPVVRRFLRRYGRWIQISEADLDRVLSFFDRYGQPIVFFGRLIPIVRSLISVPAGMHRMPLPTFLLFTLLGSAIWTSLLTYAGVVLGANWESILVYTKRYERFTLLVVVATALVFFGSRLLRARRGGQRIASEAE
jgi:membrane protein DedA with SNARE-associated domain